uniref:Inositol hexakisphosphate and diphosphoinositol-pentakisphosphate kinase n=1 Tax=Magallana gigas TaxID=29159 RepID=K1QI48_MAGGI
MLNTFYSCLVNHVFSKGENLFEELPGGKKIVLGVCAMQKKSNSKPMHEILGRLEKFMQMQTMIFDEDVILNKPIEEWPIVDVLISFFSAGFPLDKAIEYTKLRQPFVINDLESQYTLLDRREVYKTLFENDILHPRYTVLNRKKDDTTKSQVVISDDAIEVDGDTFQRPFVEKPVSAEDHNIIIYFPQSAGGGSQKLFRKYNDLATLKVQCPIFTSPFGLEEYCTSQIGSRSSVYSHTGRLRKSGSYIYEDFMPTDGTDVKVYTVGPDYAHAEARKSPALDGKVERDEHGKEVRFPVLLSAKEKMLARRVSLAFKQTVCGFDLLRANGKSYVCDVNGFSFVKNSTKYYDDCAKILGTMIMRALAPQLHIPWVLGSAPEDIPVVPTTSGSMMELRSVVAVIRHGDRTPKQKMKMEVKHRKFFELFEKYEGYRKGHLKLKKPKQLQEVLDIARFLLSENEKSSDPEVCEKKAKLQQLKLVLEMYGHFSGINRKVQLKYQPFGHRKSKRSSSEDEVWRMFDLLGPLSRYKFTGIHRKIQLKYQPSGRPFATSSEDDVPHPPSLLLIVKWGGELTPAGKVQAEELGKAFRTLYPGGQGQFESPGLGFLRLHSTFRHDLKIYASDEGRVQMTAAAFTKGLLALEGELPPILVQMVKSANTNGLLDKQGETSKYQQVVKERLTHMLNEDKEFDEDDYFKLAPTYSESLIKALDFIKNPRKLCEHVYSMVKELTAKIRTLKLEHRTRDLKLYHGESWELLIRRWAKLEKDFKMKDGRFDVSKIPDIYDCIKYDLQHNQKTIQYEGAKELFECSKALADIVIPQEYGITVDEKLHISQSVCTPLMRKIRSDMVQCVSPDEEDESTRLNSLYSLGVASPERFVRTRLYFTSESHIHSLLNMLRYGGLRDENAEEQWRKALDFINNTPELNYMTQIIIMMFEDPSKDSTSDERFHIELHFSPGAYSYGEKGFHYPLIQSKSMASGKLRFRYVGTISFQKNGRFCPVGIATDNMAQILVSDTLNVHIVDKNGKFLLFLDIVCSNPMRLALDEAEPVRSQSLEEKRSRSLEDKPAEPKVDRHDLYDRHYLTVHLPLASDKRRNSCSSLFYLNPETLKENYIIQREVNMCRSRSASSWGSNTAAFEGFNMVPSLHPLETLHNKLTMKELDDFLTRATTSKFVTPISSPPYSNTPLASPHVPVTRAPRGNQSSSNSSTGPSSPVSGMGSLVLSRLQDVATYIFQRQDSNQDESPSC